MATRPPDSSGAFEPKIMVDRQASEGPPDLDIWDGKLWQAGWQAANAQEDYGLNQSRYMNEAVDQIWDELRQRGHRIDKPVVTVAGVAARNVRGTPRRAVSARPGDFVDRQSQIFRVLAQEQARDPKFLPEYRGITDQEGLFQFGLKKRQADLATAQATLSRGGGWSRTGVTLATGLAHGLTDPTSFIPLPGMGQVAGGLARQIVVNAGREAAANAAVAVAMEPLVRADAGSMGIERTMGDTVTDVALQAGTGAIIGGGATAIAGLAGGLRDRASEEIFLALPEKMQRRWMEAGTREDRLAVLDLRRAMPEDQWTPEIRDAVHVLERTSDIAEASPFPPGRRNDEAHLDALATAHGALIGGDAGSIKARLKGGTSLARAPAGMAPSPVGASGAATFMARVRGAESGGNDLAKAATSSAFGRYQFTAGTWISYYTRRFGRGGLSEAEILTKRADGGLQDMLMADLTRDNARALQRAGHAEDAGNLYLLHFAGERRGLALLTADPDTPVSAIMSADTISANRAVLEGRTAGEVVAWAQRKMGGKTGVSVAPQASGDGEAAHLRQDADALQAEADRMLEMQGEGIPARRALDDDPAFADAAMPEPLPREEIDEPIVGELPALTIDPDSPAPLIEAIIGAGGMDIDRGFSGQTSDAAAYSERSELIGRLTGMPVSRERIGQQPVSRIGWGQPERVLPYGLIDARRGVSIDAIAERAADAGIITGDSVETRRAALIDALAHELGGPDTAGRTARLEAVAEAVDQRAMQRWDADDPIWDEINAREAEDAVAASAQGDPAVLLAQLDAKLFDDPDGPEVQAMIESIDHDLRLIAEREPDARYRVEEGGDERSVADMLAEHDEDARTLETIRGCL